MICRTRTINEIVFWQKLMMFFNKKPIKYSKKMKFQMYDTLCL